MELKNSFVVHRPVDETWALLTGLERIAPCMPGARLTGIDGDEYRGRVKVKVGPIVANYEGVATISSRDDRDHVATITATGRDPRQGNADAVITAALTPEVDDSTSVDLSTDLSLSGKLAGFGRGTIEDVASNILSRFAANLESMLAEEAQGEKPHEAGSENTADGGPAGVGEPEPIDLTAAAAVPILKRVLPVIVGLALVAVAIRLWSNCRRR